VERDLGLHVMPLALLERQPCLARGQPPSRRRTACNSSSYVQGEPAATERPGESKGASA
jgi:hypothetical protein